MSKQSTEMIRTLLLAGFLASSIVVSSAQSPPPSPQDNQKPAAAAAKPVAASPPPNRSNRLPRRAEMYYVGLWGVDELHVKATESGVLIRFNYRVVDPEKAAALNDKKAEPELIDSQAGVKLVVPQMEKVGKLRQSSTPIAGNSYWMAFSNPGRHVKRGDRVDVVIGKFRAEGLVVE